MKRISLLVLLGWGLSLTLLVLIGSGEAAQAARTATTHYVAPGGNCGGATPCYATVQAAVDAAADGDLIKVAQGTYTGVFVRDSLTQTVYLDKAVTLRGGFTSTDWTTYAPDAHPTVLDAEEKGRVLYITGSGEPTVEGFHITGGNAQGLGGAPWGDAGGGIYVDGTRATLSHLLIYSNTADFGGGIYLKQAAARVHNSFIHHNGDLSRSAGGGVYLFGCQGVTFRDNRIEKNRARDGGGMMTLGTQGLLENTHVVDNVASYEGGGLKVTTSNLVLRRAVVMNNQAPLGGGISFFGYGEHPRFESVRIMGNQASERGGGIYFNYLTHAVMTNTVVAANTSPNGSALYIQDSSPRMVHTTVANNTGGPGIVVTSDSEYYDSHVTMTNTIIAGHSTAITATQGNTVTLNATLWHGNTTDRAGNGLVQHAHDTSGDPKFAFDGYHLLAGSAAINKGIDAGVTVDIDGDFRPQAGGYDLGADEYGGTVVKAHKLYLSLVARGR